MSEVTNQEWEKLFAIMNGYVYTQTLTAACELDLFTFLSNNPGASRDQIQADLSLSAHSARTLLLACCAVGLVERDDGTFGYRNSDIAAKTLVAGSRNCATPFVLLTSKIMERCGMHLTQCLRDERNTALDKEFPGDGATLYERLGQYPEMEQLFQDALCFYSSVNYSLDQLSEFSQIHELLDVGGGNGSNASRLCKKFPDLRATVIELPQGCDIGRRYVDEQGLSDRISFMAGDMFSDPFPGSCDGVLMAHLAEIFSEDTVAELYKKASDYLPDKGKLIIWSPAANDLETGGIEAAKLSLYFLSTASGEGTAWSFKVHEHLLKQSGFSDISHYDGILEHTMIVATKYKRTRISAVNGDRGSDRRNRSPHEAAHGEPFALYGRDLALSDAAAPDPLLDLLDRGIPLGLLQTEDLRISRQSASPRCPNPNNRARISARPDSAVSTASHASASLATKGFSLQQQAPAVDGGLTAALPIMAGPARMSATT